MADDPSAIFLNPAGIVQVKGANVMAGATAVDVHSTYKSPSGNVETSAPNTPVIPHFFASYSGETSPWAFGVGVVSPFGLATKWRDDSFSRYYATTDHLYM